MSNLMYSAITIAPHPSMRVNVSLTPRLTVIYPETYTIPERGTVRCKDTYNKDLFESASAKNLVYNLVDELAEAFDIPKKLPVLHISEYDGETDKCFLTIPNTNIFLRVGSVALSGNQSWRVELVCKNKNTDLKIGVMLDYGLETEDEIHREFSDEFKILSLLQDFLFTVLEDFMRAEKFNRDVMVFDLNSAISESNSTKDTYILPTERDMSRFGMELRWNNEVMETYVYLK